MRSLSSLALVVSLCGAASAQTYVLDIDAGASNFTWSGTSTLGPIVGNPSNAFHLEGTIDLDLAFQDGAQPVASLAFNGGSAAVVPDLHGRIDNPVPFLPPLATIDVLGLVLSPTSSPASTPDGAGAFTALLTLTATAGTLIVDPLTSGPSSTSLAGNSSVPTATNGTITQPAGTLHLVVPVNASFPFTDTTTGASGTITVVGTLVADHALVKGFCAGDGSGLACPCGNNAPAGSGRGCLNSLGTGALLGSSGSADVSSDTFVLNGIGMPATATALYFQGTLQAGGGAGTAFGDGKRCAGGTVIRLGTKTNAGGASSYPGVGDASVSVRGALPATGGTRTYQTWYRNSAVFCTADTFNLTNGLRVTWLP